MTSVGDIMEKLYTESGTMYEYHYGRLFKNGVELDFVDLGEEGRVFRDKDLAVKVYHEFPNKEVLSEKEINKMKDIETKRIVLPKEVIKNDKTRGYTMEFIKGDNESIYTMNKETLVDELNKLREDLEKLGKKKIMISDLRDSNFLSTNDRFYLIDSGDYMITNTDCSDLNISTFNDFFLQDILGIYLFEEATADKALDAYDNVKKGMDSFEGDLASYVDDNFNGSIEEEVKRLVR